MHQAEENDKTNRWSMICQISISLVLPALIILIFLPSLIFTYFEGWDYSISVYYSFVTLLTIGFGDYEIEFITYSNTFRPKIDNYSFYYLGDFVPTFQAHQVSTKSFHV